jgi:hypothetical protein
VLVPGHLCSSSINIIFFDIKAKVSPTDALALLGKKALSIARGKELHMMDSYKDEE